MEIKILTAYPEAFPGTLQQAVVGNALKKNKWSLQIINLHDFGYDLRKNIDDEPFGGGPGMVIRPDVVEKALIFLGTNEKVNSKLIYMSPSGIPLNQKKLAELSQKKTINHSLRSF